MEILLDSTKYPQFLLSSFDIFVAADGACPCASPYVIFLSVGTKSTISLIQFTGFLSNVF